MPAVEVDDLTIRYGTVTAVDHLTFSVEPGEVVALLGPNGAGKTSTVEALEGYRRPTAGRVRVLGFDPVADHREMVPSIGVMLQDGGVGAGVRPLEALRLHASFYAEPDDPEALLDRVGLIERRNSSWRSLSGGERQRLSLALALVGRPLVAFLDEPTAGVDVRGRQLIRTVIRELAHAGTCVVVTTHELDEAERVADRVVIVDRGRLVASGTPQELMAAGGTGEIRFAAPPGIDTAGLGRELMAGVTEVSPGEYLIEVEASPANIATLTRWLADHDLPLADLRAGRQRLEDVFLRLTAVTGEVPAVVVDREPGARGGVRRRSPEGRSRRGARRSGVG